MSRTIYLDHNGNEIEPPTEPPIVTNYDRVISMTPENLAILIGDNIDCCICKKMHGTDECPRTDGKDCYGIWLDWLQSPVEVGT